MTYFKMKKPVFFDRNPKGSYQTTEPPSDLEEEVRILNSWTPFNKAGSKISERP